MKLSKLSLFSLIPAINFGAALPFAQYPEVQLGSILLDHRLSELLHSPLASGPGVKSENEKFLDRWASNFGAPAPVEPPSTAPRTFTKALTSTGNALLGLFGSGSGTTAKKQDKGKGRAREPIRDTDTTAEDVPEKHVSFEDDEEIIAWRDGPPEYYAGSFDSELEAGPSGTYAPPWSEKYMPDGKLEEEIEASFWDGLTTVKGVQETSEKLNEEFLEKSLAKNESAQDQDAWYTQPTAEKRSGWQKFLDWCKMAWDRVASVFKKKKDD